MYLKKPLYNKIYIIEEIYIIKLIYNKTYIIKSI